MVTLQRTFPFLLAAIAAIAAMTGCGSPVVPVVAPLPFAIARSVDVPIADEHDPLIPFAIARSVDVPIADEHNPLTHVKRLSDPTASGVAAYRLGEFVKEAMTQDDNDQEYPHVKQLLDTIMVPMLQLCEAGSLVEDTRSTVVTIIVDARDRRGAMCLIKMIESFTPNNTEGLDDAVRGVNSMKIKDAAGPLFKLFINLQDSKLNTNTTQYMGKAMLEFVDPSWEGQCLTMIDAPVRDERDVERVRDQEYMQGICAAILGRLKSVRAVKPLIKLVLSPMKPYAQWQAKTALLKIGKPSVGPLVTLLKGEDLELIEYAKVEYLRASAASYGPSSVSAKKAAPTAYLVPAAQMLGFIGRDEATQPMLDALTKANDVDKVLIVIELLRLPSTPASLDAVKRIYEKTPISLAIQEGSGAHERMIRSIGKHDDASVVPWLVRAALDAKGAAVDVSSVRFEALRTAMRLMKADQIAIVDKLARAVIHNLDDKSSPLGTDPANRDKDEYMLAKDLLKECGDSIDCYYGKLKDLNSYTGVKAILADKTFTMIGVLGGPEVPAKLMGMVSPTSSSLLGSSAAIRVIERHAPKGDVTIATQLQKIVDEAKAAAAVVEAKEQAKWPFANPEITVVYIMFIASLEPLIDRLNARAQ